MNAEQTAAQNAMDSLADELSLVDASEKFRKWKRPKGSITMYFWKCPCGNGQRYTNEPVMRKMAQKHQSICPVLKGQDNG